MLAFIKERLVFLSVPKTGTTAIEAALRDRADLVMTGPPGIKHMPLYRYNKFVKPLLDKVRDRPMETMAVVREPIDWLGSWYRYRRRAGMEGKPNSTHDVSFDAFVRAYMQSKQPDFANVGSQARFINAGNGRSGVTHLFRYENQNRIVGFLEDRLSVKLDTQRKNVSPAIDLELTDETEQAFRNGFSQEFEAYEIAD